MPDSIYPQLLRNPVNGAEVIIAPKRAERPHQHRSTNFVCPFCPGQEQETPPEVAAIRRRGSQPNQPGWQVRVVPNRYPAVEQSCKEGTGQCTGLHEVIIESNEHQRSWKDFSQEQLERVLRIYRSRLKAHREAGLKYSLLFKNVGHLAGASLDHCHSQLVSLTTETDSSWKRPGQLRNECQKVKETSNFRLLCPDASRFMNELWILPRKASPCFSRLKPAALKELATILIQLTSHLETKLGCENYNLVFHNYPADSDGSWRLEILPRFSQPAGFEFGSGIFINPVSSQAARRNWLPFSRKG